MLVLERIHPSCLETVCWVILYNQISRYNFGSLHATFVFSSGYVLRKYGLFLCLFFMYCIFGPVFSGYLMRVSSVFRPMR